MVLVTLIFMRKFITSDYTHRDDDDVVIHDNINDDSFLPPLQYQSAEKSIQNPSNNLSPFFIFISVT